MLEEYQVQCSRTDTIQGYPTQSLILKYPMLQKENVHTYMEDCTCSIIHSLHEISSHICC